MSVTRPRPRFGWRPDPFDGVTVGSKIEWEFEGRPVTATVIAIETGWTDMSNVFHPEILTLRVYMNDMGYLGLGLMPRDLDECDKLDLKNVRVL